MKGQILIIPEAVFDFLHPFKMFSFRCYYYTNRITIKCNKKSVSCVHNVIAVLAGMGNHACWRNFKIKASYK